MANASFEGPVRSANGFQVYSGDPINDGTDVINSAGDVVDGSGNVIVDVSAGDILNTAGDVVIDGSTGDVTIAATDNLVVTTADKLTVGGKIVPATVPIATFFANTPGECVDQIIFVAQGAWEVSGVAVRYGTAESTATNLRVQVERLQGTEAADAGDDLLTDNSNAGINLKATANTTYDGTMVSDGTEDLADGNALGLVFEAAATELDNLAITIYGTRI